MQLALKATLEHALIAALVRADPFECCGLIVGERPFLGDALVPLRNVAGDRSLGFAFDDVEHLVTRRAVKAQGRTVVAMYHSHPRTPPSPSMRDTRALHVDGEPLFPDECMIIVGRERPDATPVVRAFHVVIGRSRLVGCDIRWITSGGHVGRPQSP